MSKPESVEIAIIGAGLAGLATAYYLCEKHKKRSVLLIDKQAPMNFTSAQSGDNYRNWWPHPVMTDFSNHSIDLMEKIAISSDNRIHMNRRGYVLATRRADIHAELDQLERGFASEQIRFHNTVSAKNYQNPSNSNWQEAPSGVDVLSEPDLIRQTFPSFTHDIKHVIHIRRAGDINGQELGQTILDYCKAVGVKTVRSEVKSIQHKNNYILELESDEGCKTIHADILINAAGPYVNTVAQMLDSELPIENVFQQKILFADTQGLVSRDLPFCIDLDEQLLNWTPEEKELFSQDPETGWLIKSIQGGVHCRPDGGVGTNRVKLGWAYNTKTGDVQADFHNDKHFNDSFPEIVLRGASALNPKLKYYVDKIPMDFSHYGGYYTMTKENWPLIGPLDNKGTFVVGALSGFGTMAACAAGELCATWVVGKEVPAYAKNLSLSRYRNSALMSELHAMSNTGIL